MNLEQLQCAVAFYDRMREHGSTDYSARHQTIWYIARKLTWDGDTMPLYESLADALARRASAAVQAAQSSIVQDPHVVGMHPALGAPFEQTEARVAAWLESGGKPDFYQTFAEMYGFRDPNEPKTE